MFGLGVPELLIILVIVLVVFGARQIPHIGTGLAQGIRNFKRASKEPDFIDVTPSKEENKEKK